MITGSNRRIFGVLMAALAWAGSTATPLTPARANDHEEFETAFDSTFGTQPRIPQLVQRAPVYQFQPVEQIYKGPLEASLGAVAGADHGRIGVAAMDLSSGQTIEILGNVPFPMASTSKIAIVATFLEGVDQGRFKLSDRFPLMVPVPSRRFAGQIAPVQPGKMLTAQSLIELALTRSDNQATDGLLAAVGGPGAVNRWLQGAGIRNFRIDRDIATLVRDDGEYDPAVMVDMRDSATPLAMVQLLSGLYRGQWLRPASRAFLLGTMERCITGKRRIPAQLPDDARVAHKTGSLNNTSSDVGIVHLPDGRVIAMAIYVTGQGGRPAREARIATIARTIYDGYLSRPASGRRTAAR